MKNVEKQPRLSVLTGAPLSPALIGKDAVRPEEPSKILMITDFSDEAIHAERRAAMLCCELEGQALEVMAVLNSGPAAHAHKLAVIGDEGGPQVRDVELGLREVSTRLREWPSLNYVCSIRFGNPIAAVIDRAEEVDASMMVVASYKVTLAETLNRGYGTNDLVRAIERPSLVVNRAPQQVYTKVVIAVDMSEPLSDMVSTTIRLAGDAEYHFLFVIDDNKAAIMLGDREANETRLLRRMREEQMMRASLSGFVEKLRPDLKQDSLLKAVRRGHPSSAICGYANEIGADLIVCGKRAAHYRGDGTLGSVTTDLLAQTACDVLIVPPEPAGKKYFDRPAA